MFSFKKNKIVIYTAIFGDRDKLKNPLYEIKYADLICFTDNPENKNKYFKTILREPGNSDSNRAAKKYKILGDPIIDKYEYSIWVDGNHLLKFKDAQKVIDEILIKNQEDLAFMKHPEGRDCIYQEYDFIVNKLQEKIDDLDIIKNQINKYRNEGFPENSGLIAGGFIVRRVNSPEVKKIMEAWWNEIEANSRRDQLSFNYVIWKLKETYGNIPGLYWDNEYIKWLDHNN